ncbi:MAG TPA: 5-(carboxyamino)imidazole ribonucleotide synthase [Egibacteraceae bacterium]|nr:5-(carboxyamino)imidazole ribonucleotide synthase [Egibacteraceae bacterium]
MAPVVGMVGAGQLARMTAQAAVALDVRLRVLASDPADSATAVAAEVVLGAPDDPDGLAALAKGADAVTFDHELVEPALIQALERDGALVRPGSGVIAVVIDKRRQREALAGLGAPQPEHRVVGSREEMAAFGEAHGWPLVLKAARGGYDGRGVWVAAGIDEAAAVLDEAHGRGLVLLAERHVAMDCEVAVVVARRPSGEAVAYPVVQTVQRDGMLRELRYPAPVSHALAGEARRLALDVAERLGVVGLLAVELFVEDGALLVNELAARPHNSGHASIEGCVTSQFANHLRAVLDWPLGATDAVAPAFALVNVVGPADGSDPAGRLPAALAVPGLAALPYRCACKPGRKLGHVTVVGDDLDEVTARARRGAAILHGEETA